MNKRNLILGCLVRAAVGCQKEPTSATAAIRDVEGFVVLSGELVTPPTEYAAILPPYRAPVDKVMATLGSRVREGGVLLTLRFPNAEASLEQARANLRSAQASLDAARSANNLEVKRLEAELASLRSRQNGGEEVSYEIGVVTDQLTAARSNLAMQLRPFTLALSDAQNYVKEAQAGVKIASVRAPLSGTIISLEAHPGVEIGAEADQPIITIANLESLEVHCRLTPEQVAQVKRDLPITITFESLRETFEGNVKRVVTRAGEDGKVQYVAILDFRNKEGLIKPGFRVKGAAVKIGEADDVLAVPSEAVDRDGSGRWVVMVLKDGNWSPTVVEIGLSGHGFTEIKSGLKEGETVQVTP